jgi:hypothetical protein
VEHRIDRHTVGLGIAVTYPVEAFSTDEGQLVERCRAMVERAGRGESVATEVQELLRQHPRLNEWVAQVLEDPQHRPPHLQPDAVRSYRPMPGDADSVPARSFTCGLHNGFVWYQRSVANPVPPCPFCGSILVAT